MKRRALVSLIGAGATVMAFGVGSGMATGAAHAAPKSGGSPAGSTGLVAQAKLSEQATLVATTTLSSAYTGDSGSTALPAKVPSSEMPRTPDVGDNASSKAPVRASLSHSQSHKPSSGVPLPTVTGIPVTGATAGLSSVGGLNAYDQGVTHLSNGSLPGVDIEPSDQGLCAGAGYTLELNNEVAEVFGPGLAPQGIAPLESLFATPQIFGNSGDGSYSIQGDPRCSYDAATGRWFASQLWLDLNDATTFGWAGSFIAVSKTSDPTGSWNVYFVPDMDNSSNTATCNNDAASNANANPCFGDQPLLGMDGSTVQLSTNEYSINGSMPNGQANLYFLSKSALVAGSASVPVFWSPVGATVAAPGVGPWYSLTPAQVPDGGYLSANNGTSYALSSLDFTGSGDQRIAEWAYTNTNSIGSRRGAIDIYEQTLASGLYAMPPMAAQESGPTPLGDFWNQITGAKGKNPLPEGPVQTNDDRMGTVAYDPSSGALVGALNTALNQASATGSASRELAGVAYFTVTPALSSGGLNPSTLTTGYISPDGANAFFPAIAITATGAGLVAYALSGSGYYPSTAYSLVAAGDSVAPAVHVASAGAGPQDGFSEYQDLGTSSYEPRWGDYSAAVVDGSTVSFASEKINQSCTDSQFQADFTCGGTRDLFINWGTSVNQINP